MRFYLQGDLSQMAAQKIFLRSNFVETEQSDVYPTVAQEDVKRALTLIWENRVEGWWHYEEKYGQLEICMKEDFRTALSEQCA